MKTEKNFQKSWFQECFKNLGSECFFFKSNKKYYGSAALFLRWQLPGILSYSRAKWIVQSTKQRNLLNRVISFVYLYCRHDGLKEKKKQCKKRKTVQETDNSFCHREIFSSLMGFKENKWGFNLLTLQLLPLLDLCKP